MKVYIQCDKHGFPASHNFFVAYEGFKELGAEIHFFYELNEVPSPTRNLILVSFVEPTRVYLHKWGYSLPDIDYPTELSSYLERKIWLSTMDTIRMHPEQWPVFIKPLEDKVFTGVLVQSMRDLIRCGSVDDCIIRCSEPVEFITEWRCFVRYGRILDVRHYKGDWRACLDTDIVEQAVREYSSAPSGYAIDFGLTKDGKTLLVEVNDGYALGEYGLFYLDYAKLLSARWCELTDGEDEYNF